VELRGDTEIEQAIVYIGSAEVGQGVHSVVRQMAAEAAGVPLEKVLLVASDTATSPGSAGSVSSSRTTLMAGNAVRGAVEHALKKWRAEERPAIAEHTYLAPKTTQFDLQTGYGTPNFSYGYAAQAVEVEVDTATGELHIVRVVCADDTGKAINPQQVVGQIEGGVLQAMGWATHENFITSGGRVLTPSFSTYLIPTINDLPDQVASVILERANPHGPWGARGLGEMPFIPFAPALVAALYNATGVWFDSLPLTPERVLQGLKAASQ